MNFIRDFGQKNVFLIKMHYFWVSLDIYRIQKMDEEIDKIKKIMSDDKLTPQILDFLYKPLLLYTNNKN